MNIFASFNTSCVTFTNLNTQAEVFKTVVFRFIKECGGLLTNTTCNELSAVQEKFCIPHDSASTHNGEFEITLPESATSTANCLRTQNADLCHDPSNDILQLIKIGGLFLAAIAFTTIVLTATRCITRRVSKFTPSQETSLDDDRYSTLALDPS